MTDVINPQTPNDAAGNDAQPQDEKTFSADYVKQLRDEAKQYRLQLRELSEKFSAIESQAKTANEAKMAEDQRWKELAEVKAKELDEIKTQLERERIGALRMRIASEKQLPAALAERLSGSTEDELRADAEKLAELLPASTKPTATRQATQLPTGEPSTNRDADLHKWLFGPYRTS